MPLTMNALSSVAAGVAFDGLDGRRDCSLDEAVVLLDESDVVGDVVSVPIKENYGAWLHSGCSGDAYCGATVDLQVVLCCLFPRRAVTPVEELARA